MQLLTMEIDKDNLNELLSVINMLNKIEERQLETDRMFEPLKEIMLMLKEYKYEFEPKIYLQVDVTYGLNRFLLNEYLFSDV